MATKISDQEKRNVWLSVYSSAISGLVGATEEHDEESEEDNAEIATGYADRGLEDFLVNFGEIPPDEGEEEDPDEPHPKRRSRRAR